MAVTNESSTQYKQATDPRTNGRLAPEDTPLDLRTARFEFTQGAAAGDAASTIDLVQLPAGRVVVFPKLSWIQWQAFGAARVLDVGHAAYVDETGATVAISANKWDDDIDVSAAGGAVLGSDMVIADAPGTEFFSSAGVKILATLAGGTIPAGTKINGYITYMPVGS